jgi:hypothetical protein
MSEVLATLFKYLLGILAIAAVVVVYFEANASGSASTEVSNITYLDSHAAQLYASSSNTTTLTDKTLVNAAAVPSNMVSGTNIVNTWGGAVTVTGDAAGDIIIKDAAMPASACTKIVTGVQSYATVAINAVAAAAGPLDPGTASASCATATPATVTFTFTGQT